MHFNSPNHTIADISALAIEQVHNELNSSTMDFLDYLHTYFDYLKLRRDREKYWQNILGTIYPQGLNCMRTDINIEAP